MIDEDKLKKKILEQRTLIKNQTIALTVIAQMLDGLCDSVDEVAALCQSGSDKDLKILHILMGGDAAWEDDDDDDDYDDDDDAHPGDDDYIPDISNN